MRLKVSWRPNHNSRAGRVSSSRGKRMRAVMKGSDRSGLTAKSTYMNHRATVTVLQGCQESHTSVSSLSISQQQKFWLSHQPSEQ